MKTEKLYYKDAYISEFDARVISCDKTSEGFDIVLDKTAFFPEAGGQYSDKGYIGSSEVTDAREIDGVIHHYAKEAVNVNNYIHCALDFAERFDKMQQHTAEHIVSGLFHSLYGVENTGFHLGATDVTLDTSRPVTKEELAAVERLVNLAIQKNAKVEAVFPSAEELKTLEYRSKLELTEDVRIVNIEGYDSCACCAPHVCVTGEIGVFKFVDAVKHKGGSRIRMLAGMRAYDYVAKLASEASAVSVMLSAPATEISAELERQLAAMSELEGKLFSLGKEMAALLAENLDASKTVAVAYCPSLDAPALRVFANRAVERGIETVVALTGDEGCFRYILHSSAADFQKTVKEANLALSGKGGGRPPMATGTFSARLDEIKRYFESRVSKTE